MTAWVTFGQVEGVRQPGEDGRELQIQTVGSPGESSANVQALPEGQKMRLIGWIAGLNGGRFMAGS